MVVKNKIPLTPEDLDVKRHRITITLSEKEYEWFIKDAEAHHLPVITHARVTLLNYKDGKESKNEQ